MIQPDDSNPPPVAKVQQPFNRAAFLDAAWKQVEQEIPPQLRSVTKEIYCRNSGVPLATLTTLILDGFLAYVEAHNETLYLHPFYKLSNTVLLKKLESSLHSVQGKDWAGTAQEKQRVQLLVSAIMHNFGCIKQEQPSLPDYAIAVGSAGRLLGLAKWFFFLSSQRLQFPTYSISKKNNNLNWENFRYWLDSAYEIREEWSSSKRRLQVEEEQRAREASLREIKSESVRKIDTRKVWKWIEVQLEGNYSPGRIETFRNLFLNGDIESQDWNTDDVDDVREAVFKHCDSQHEIMFYIRKRLDGIAAILRDFYSSFTIISQVRQEGAGGLNQEGETEQEKEFFSDFDQKAKELEELPAEPKRESFQTQGLFMQAHAKWSILKRRWEQLRKQQDSGKKE